jgi:RNA polymerase sigma-70 factor, ECF subfamily
LSIGIALTAAEANGRSRNTEALYRAHGAAVAGLCRSLLRDHGEAEDATQQVFLSAHRALLNGAVPREPLAWLLAVARNECYARFRERAVAPVPAADAPDAATTDASVQALRAEELADLWDEVGRMPPTQREAFLLREVRGLSYGQLADELSLSRPSVRSLLLRARTRLRRRLGDVAARLVAGGDGGSPVPAATKAAAVGVGALALAGGGGLVARHASRTIAHTAARDHTRTRIHRAAAPAAVAVAPREDRPRLDDRATRLVRSSGRDDGARESRSGMSGSPSGRDERGRSSHDGSDDTSAAAQPTTDGHDEGGSSSSGPDPEPSGESSSSGSGHDDAGSDGGSGPSTITTSSGSSGSDGSDSSGSGSSDDSGTSHDPASGGGSGGGSDGGSSDGHGG